MMQKKQALASLVLVEDNDSLREELENYLTDEGFDVRGVDSGESLNQTLMMRPADILILDLNMAEEDGISICKRIRKSMPEVGILMLTARVMNSDKLAGYESGADIYMTKPARPAELAAALRNLHNRMLPKQAHAKWVLDTKLLSIRNPNKASIAITLAEAKLLKLLAMNNEYVDLETIQKYLQDENLDSAKFKLRLEVLISRLRTKIDVQSERINPIKSVRGRGYLLCIDIEIV
jgi:DNA-binding response OmpR family regulator